MKTLIPVKTERVERYNGVKLIFDTLYHEIKELGKKKPETTLSKAKVAQINRVLEDAQFVIADEPEKKYCDLLEADLTPQFSDALIIMAQFEGALKAFRSRHYGKASPLQDEPDWVLVEDNAHAKRRGKRQETE